MQGFSKITVLFILLLKATELSDLALQIFKADNNEDIKIGGRANETVVNLFKNNKSIKSINMLNIEAIGEAIFLIFNVKKAFNHLKQAFIKALIF